MSARVRLGHGHAPSGFARSDRDEDRWAAHLPQPLADPHGELLRDGSLPARWVRRWAERPAWRQLRDVDGTWMSSERLEERSRRAANSLVREGLVPGDRVLVCGSTGAPFVIAYVGALRAGLVVVPINPAYTEPEVARIVRDARPAAALVEDPAIARWVARASARPLPIHPLESGRSRGPEVGCAESDHPGLDQATADDPALLIYTSGTTGEPKGALLTHGNLLSSATAVDLAWRWRPEDRLLLALPLFHMHGLGVGINGTLCAGASVELRPRFDPADVARRCARADVSLFFAVPAMYQRLHDAGLAGELRRVRLLVSGSAPLPAALAERIAAEAGQVPLERYGMTETGMLTSNPYAGPRKPGTVGFQLPGVKLRLADDGEVQVRGPNVIAGYWNASHPGRPEADPQAFTADGWFRTGDLATLDDAGYLRLVGRAKELIITGGYNVHPREVEEALASHPAVREAAVVGRPSRRWGEEVTAVVVAAGPVEERELLEHLAGRLAPYKVPKRVEFVAELPRNAMGKVVRSRL